MKADYLIQEYNKQIAKVHQDVITDVYARLVELFKEIKSIQPNLVRIHMGMGSWSFEGLYTCEVMDYSHVRENYPDLEYITGELTDEDGDKWIVYKDHECKYYEDYIESAINGFSYRDFEDKHLHPFKYVNDAAIEFYELCCYLQDINGTTQYDGVNENGVIVSYGKGSHLDTYVDAVESDEVEMLEAAGIPIVFHDTVRGEYDIYNGEKF